MTAPDRIYLKRKPVRDILPGGLWWKMPQAHGDVTYIRLDLYKAALAEIAELNDRLNAVRAGYDALIADCEGR